MLKESISVLFYFYFTLLQTSSFAIIIMVEGSINYIELLTY